MGWTNQDRDFFPMETGSLARYSERSTMKAACIVGLLAGLVFVLLACVAGPGYSCAFATLFISGLLKFTLSP